MNKTILMRGIDVSKWQGMIDFNKVKQSGIDFVIIKAGGSDGSYYKDPYFERNYYKAQMAGLKVGTYFFCGANFFSDLTARAVSVYFSNIIKDKPFDMPIVLDIEATEISVKKQATDCAIKCAKLLEDLGYFVTIYGSEISVFRDRLNVHELTSFDLWVAKYSNNKPSLNCGMWQYSSSGNVSGITGNVDLDYAFRSYSEIPSYKLNNTHNTMDIAFDIIRGLFGNGEERKNNLEKLGYNYNEVQKEVNRILRLWG